MIFPLMPRALWTVISKETFRDDIVIAVPISIKLVFTAWQNCEEAGWYTYKAHI